MKLIALIALTAALAAGCAPPKQNAPSSPVLATVNGSPITAAQFNEDLKYLKLGYSNESGLASPGNEAKMDLLSQMIEEEVCLQEAGRLKVAPSDAEVEERLSHTMAGYTGVFGRSLKQTGEGLADYKAELRRKMTVEKLVDLAVYSKVHVDRQDAIRYFEENRDEFRTKARVHARQIVVASQKDAKALLSELKKGADFQALARSRSLSPDSRTGGDLGYFARGEMPREFDVVFRLKPGKLSGIVKTPYGYHIFRVEDVQKPHDPKFEEVEGKVRKALAMKLGEEAFERWMMALKARTKVEVNFKELGRL